MVMEDGCVVDLDNILVKHLSRHPDGSLQPVAPTKEGMDESYKTVEIFKSYVLSRSDRKTEKNASGHGPR